MLRGEVVASGWRASDRGVLGTRAQEAGKEPARVKPTWESGEQSHLRAGRPGHGDSVHAVNVLGKEELGEKARTLVFPPRGAVTGG